MKTQIPAIAECVVFAAAHSALAEFDIRDYGAAETNTAAENAAAIQKAIDAAGNGEAAGEQSAPRQCVVVPPGTFLTGTLWLRSHVELRLEKGAVLKASTRHEDYNANDAFPENFHSFDEEWSGGHLILGYKVEDVAITGRGTIDGSGISFFGEPDEDSRFPGYKYGLRLHPLDREWFRPGPLVAFFLSKGIRLDGVKIVDSPCWTTHFRCCEGVSISGVSISNDRTVANTDGFSIDCSRNVTVSGCTVVTGDDAVAIRASCGHHAAVHPCENIVVEDCDFASCAMGVRIGIGTGTIRDVVIRRCRIREAAQGIKFHAAWRTGSKAKGVDIGHVRVEDCDVLQCDHPVRNLGGAAEWGLRDVLFERCRFESLQPVALLGDETHHPENIVFRDCERVHLDHLRVRHHRGYGGERSREFLQIDGEADVRLENCAM
jgi:polygalacturonase